MMKTCPHCGGKYDIEIGVTYDEFRTADPHPPAYCTIYAQRKLIHSCRKGVTVL